MDTISLNAPVTLKKTSLSTDNEGVPKLQVVLEVTGRAALDVVPISELAALLGKSVQVTIRDTQLRLELAK